MQNLPRRKLFKYLLLFFLGLGIFLFLAGGFYWLLSSNSPKTSTQSSSVVSLSRSPNCGSKSGGPFDNPIAAKYGENTYRWTNNIKWGCVYNIKDFGGNNLIEQFNSAMNAAVFNGGGVIYFPAGSYNFTDSIFLKNGVVIRGEAPKVTDVKSDQYAPASKLVFPKYEPSFSGNGTDNTTAFKKIFTSNSESDSNIGLVNLDINRAGINFSGNVDQVKKQNIVVFGVRNNNVADPANQVPDPSFQESWMRYSDRFTANIKISALANVLVANNRINDTITDNYEQPGYKLQSVDKKEVITYTEGNKVPFDYGIHYGIVVNRSKAQGFALAGNPKNEPGLFRKGIVIRDNWVFHKMRVAIHAAGDGLIIKDNVILDQANKQWWTDPTGIRQPRGAVTFENRAIDWSGWNVKIEGNNYQVYRHQVMDTPYLSVDGEGILIQECCGGTTVNGAQIVNNQGNSYIGIYKVPEVKNVTIKGNKLSSPEVDKYIIYVVADTNNAPHSMSEVVIENNELSGSIVTRSSLGGTGNIIQNNIGTNGTIEYSCNVTVGSNTRFIVKPCSSVKQ